MHDVSIWTVRALVTAVESKDVARGAFLSRIALGAETLADDYARVAFNEYRSMVQQALLMTADPALGLHMGEAANTAAYDVLGPLAQHSPNLRSALATFNTYARIAADGPRFELQEQADSATVRVLLPEVGTQEACFFAEQAVGGLVMHLVPHFIGETAPPQQVLFAYGAPGHRAEYTRIFHGREQFDSPFTGVRFDRSWLDRVQLHRSADLQATLRTRADMLLSRLDRATPGAVRVQRWLASQSFERKPQMSEAARVLGMSPRSLRRLLAREATDFTQLVELARARHSERMLATGHYTVQETAHELGFANPAAFTRAFKRWTGKTPGQVRPRQR